MYAVLSDLGYFDKSHLLTLNKPETILPSHCDMNRTPGVDMTTGSLGQGFSCAVGLALGSRMRGDGATIYAMLGDGESQEGQIWEAAMLAGAQKLNNLIAFTDYNKLQLDGPCSEIVDVAPLDKNGRHSAGMSSMWKTETMWNRSTTPSFKQKHAKLRQA